MKTRPLRILVAHNVSLRRPGGMSRLMEHLHNEVKTKGHTVDYFGAEHLPKYYSGRAARFAFPWLAWRFARRAARAGCPYDVINVHEPVGAWIASLRGPLGNPSVVVMSHGVERQQWRQLSRDPLLPRPSLKSRLVYPSTSLWQSALALEKADHICCVAEDHRHYLESWLRLPEGRVTRIFPGVSPVFSEAAVQRDYGRFRTLVFAGTWIPRKGINEVVSAFSILASRHADLTLVVLGGGKSESAILAAFSDSSRARVRCVQTADELETANVFAEADAYWLPSLAEGTPLTLLEAMASGLPVVTTATCGMRDVIRQRENGILVGLHDVGGLVTAVEALSGDRELRRRLGQAARRETMEKYSWSRVAEPLVELYEGLRGIRAAGESWRRAG